MICNYQIEEWHPEGFEASTEDVDRVAEILHQVVQAGAGVSFFVPFPLEGARVFWLESVLPRVRNGSRRVLVARQGDRIVGTVQLDLATPPNQQHRADVLKLLVHPEAQGQGIGKALMRALEDVARSEDRFLLTLDTVTGSKAEHLYKSLGYQITGVIPRYARRSLSPELESATFMYKELGPV